MGGMSIIQYSPWAGETHGIGVRIVGGNACNGQSADSLPPRICSASMALGALPTF